MSPSLPTVLVLSTSFAKNATLCAELSQIGAVLHVVPPTHKTLSEDEVTAILTSVRPTIVLVGREPITERVLQSCPWVRLIAMYGVGHDNVDVEALKRRNIAFGWTPGVNRRAVSELCLGFALGHLRNIDRSIARMRQGTWDKNGGRQLSDVTFGIVGMGNVGLDLAGLLQAFGTRIVYHDIVDRTTELRNVAPGATRMSYDELLRSSDVISFHVPLSTATKNMLSASELKILRPDALVINTARGEVVDLVAACEAARGGHLGGFACDVFTAEPLENNPWSECTNIYFTPHIGGNSREAVLAMGRAAISSINAYLANLRRDRSL